MVDANNITNYFQSQEQLEEVLLFWVCAAGKKADTSAKALENFLVLIQGSNFPFLAIRQQKKLPYKLKKCGIGCFTRKAETFKQLAWSNLDLKTCTIDDLERIKGIGAKTSRCFVLHSRPNVEHIGLDTHLLKHARYLQKTSNFLRGIKIPKGTPSGKKYKIIEEALCKEAAKLNMTCAEYDLTIWKKYANLNQKSEL